MALKPLVVLGFTVSFIGGLLGGDPSGVFIMTVGAFVPACGCGGRWWPWFILSISAWSAGGAVVLLLGMFGLADVADVPAQMNTMNSILTLVAVCASSLAGTSLNWAASRMMRER